MKKIAKTIFVRNSFFVETYNMIFDIKKINKIGQKIGYDTEFGKVLSQLILEDDIIILSFCISVFFEYIKEFQHSSYEEKNILNKLLKTLKFEEFNPKNNSYNWFAEVKKVGNSNDSYDEKGIFKECYSSREDFYGLFFQLPTVEQITNVNRTSFTRREQNFRK